MTDKINLYRADFEGGSTWVKAPTLFSAAKCLQDSVLLLGCFSKPKDEELIALYFEERPDEEIESIAKDSGFYDRIFTSTYLG